DAMAQIPSSFVGARTHHPMKLQSANTLFALTHQIDDFKPRSQWIVGILENSFRDYRKPITVLLAIATLPVKRLMPQSVDLIVAATRTLNHTIRPTHVAEQRFAGRLHSVIAFYICQSQVRLSGQRFTRLHANNVKVF